MAIRLCVVLAAVVLTAGCGPEVLQITMNQISGSGQTGTATLTALDGDRTEVVVDISTGADTGNQDAHIHDGDCPGLGNIVYPLNQVIGGDSTTTLNVSLSEIRSKKRALNVHTSFSPATEYVSCGEISAR